MHSHYENLKVPRNATQKEIKAAYRKLRSEHHPDRNPDPLSTQRMQIINEAWEVLGNPEKRKKHDAEIKRQEMFDDFFQEVEEKAKAESTDAKPEPPEEEPEPEPEDEHASQLQAYFELVGVQWMRESRDSGTHAKVDPTYRVYRTDFLAGGRTFYFYACYKNEIIQRWNEVKKDLVGIPEIYGSGYLSSRLANQKLMDQMLANAGVLWTEGEPTGDVTNVFFGRIQ
jgi:curved DNA-binding protein CbpA